MLNLIRCLLFAALAFFRTRGQLAAEILALRHQLGVPKRSVKRPRMTDADRGLWVLLRHWASWSDVLIIVKPATAHQMAPGGIPQVLDLAQPAQGRPSRNRRAGAGPH